MSVGVRVSECVCEEGGGDKVSARNNSGQRRADQRQPPLNPTPPRPHPSLRPRTRPTLPASASTAGRSSQATRMDSRTSGGAGTSRRRRRCRPPLPSPLGVAALVRPPSQRPHHPTQRFSVALPSRGASPSPLRRRHPHLRLCAPPRTHPTPPSTPPGAQCLPSPPGLLCRVTSPHSQEPPPVAAAAPFPPLPAAPPRAPPPPAI